MSDRCIARRQKDHNVGPECNVACHLRSSSLIISSVRVSSHLRLFQHVPLHFLHYRAPACCCCMMSTSCSVLSGYTAYRCRMIMHMQLRHRHSSAHTACYTVQRATTHHCRCTISVCFTNWRYRPTWCDRHNNTMRHSSVTCLCVCAALTQWW